MSTAIGVVVGVVVVLLIAAVVALLLKKRAQRRRELQEQYGPEYDRAVEQTGSRRAAERELAERDEQRSQLTIVPLSSSSRARYTQSWDEVQGRFVDDPQASVADADELVTSVLRERGYPTEGFEEQARLLSVDHANTLESYRQGHQIGTLARQRQATTEQLRQGMMHYRSLFRELVDERGDETGGSHDGVVGAQGGFAADPHPTTEYARPQQQVPQMPRAQQQQQHPQAQPQPQQYAQPQQVPQMPREHQQQQDPQAQPQQQYAQPQHQEYAQPPTTPPPTLPPPFAPDDVTQPVRPHQVQPGGQLQGEPYPTDGSVPPDDAQQGERLRRRTGGPDGGDVRR
ncbi:MAG TPA: hypothetical protein VLR26_15100 [Frankiaceae bacterium]|nr:hypothetical protein [Frankiaceae bacterium]